MESMRTRAKDNLPHVLLTLLSIIQALALELLWSRLQESRHLFGWTWRGVEFWLQTGTSFLGILVIWVVYATTVMRFRWVPGISDSVVPFLLGLLQFTLIECLHPDTVGFWVLLMSLMFATMHWVSHHAMRRARQETDNVEFFSTVAPATRRDFYGPAAVVVGLAVAGVALIVLPEHAAFTLSVQAGVFALLVWTLGSVAFFWERSMTAKGA